MLNLPIVGSVNPLNGFDISGNPISGKLILGNFIGPISIFGILIFGILISRSAPMSLNCTLPALKSVTGFLRVY